LKRLGACRGEPSPGLRPPFPGARGERIRGRIRALVDRIYLLIWKGGKAKKVKYAKPVKYMLAQVHFFNGSVQTIVVNDREQGGTLLNSPIVPERDLRNYREHPWKLDAVAV